MQDGGGEAFSGAGLALPKSPPSLDSVIDFDQYDEDTEMGTGLGIGSIDSSLVPTFSYSPSQARQQQQHQEQLLEDQQRQQQSQEQQQLQQDQLLLQSQNDEGESSPLQVADIQQPNLSEDICKTIPAVVLRTFEPDSQTLSTVDDETASSTQGNAFLKALVNSIARALNGDSVVTAPILYKGFPWLGNITVKSGSLRGNLVAKHRVYTIQARVLAGGHMLPWCIGREWRYSELRKLLVDDLQVLIKKHGLQNEFGAIVESFPPKTWQNRNSDETAEYRSAAMQAYMRRLVALASQAIETRDFERSSKKKRRTRDSTLSRNRSGSGTSNQGTTSASGASGARSNELAVIDIGPPPRKNSYEELIGEGIGQIIELVVQRLLNINSELRYEVAQVSHNLGTLITMTPTDHCHVTKEFKLTPQQAL